MNLLQQKQLALGDARAELIQVGKNLARVLQNLDKWEHEEEHSLLQGHIGSGFIEIELVEKAVLESPRC